MNAKPSNPEIRHIPSLDGLRALSFLLVFVAHAGLEDRVPGGFGVTTFFFLSGYLITSLMRSEFDRHQSVNLKHFWLRRALRILPPFYLVLGVGVIAALIYAPAGLTLAGVSAQALHITNYWIIYHGYSGFPSGAGTGVYWSLAVEEHFYLLFPLLYLAMRRAGLSGRQQAGAFWMLCLLVLLWRCVLVQVFHSALDRTYMATDTRVDSILFGCALAVWHNPMLDRESLNVRRWACLYLPMSAVALLFSFYYRNPVFRETWRYSLQGIALTPLFVAAMRFPRWPVFRLLNWRPLAFLGVLSYSMYLIHYGIIALVTVLLPGSRMAVTGMLSLVITVTVAWLIYLFIEKPCARLRRRLTD